MSALRRITRLLSHRLVEPHERSMPTDAHPEAHTQPKAELNGLAVNLHRVMGGFRVGGLT